MLFQFRLNRGKHLPHFNPSHVTFEYIRLQVDHKDPMHTSLLEFGSLWQAEYSVDSLLVYSTGRSPTLYKDLKSKVPLITPGNNVHWRLNLASAGLIIHGNAESQFTLEDSLPHDVHLRNSAACSHETNVTLFLTCRCCDHVRGHGGILWRH